MNGRPINVDRQNAITFKLTTYTGSEHKCGTTQRYVSGGGCVHCARLIAAEQREARKILRAQVRAETPIVSAELDEYVACADDLVNYDHQDALDNVEHVVAEIVDQELAEADRFSQSIDDLM